MGELTAIGFTAGQSTFHQLDPRTKQILLVLFSSLSLWGHVTFLALLSIATLFFLRLAKVNFSRLIREIRYFLIFLLFVFCVRTVTLPNGWTFVSDAGGAAQALMVCWRLLLVVLMGLLVMTTTRTADIRAALVWFLKPIPWVDEKMAATMVGLLVRFLPVILIQASEISDAQRARGIDRRKNPLTRLMRFCIALFRSVFLRADELTDAMQARCYNENRTLADLAFSRCDGWAIGAGILVCLTVGLP